MPSKPSVQSEPAADGLKRQAAVVQVTLASSIESMCGTPLTVAWPVVVAAGWIWTPMVKPP